MVVIDNMESVELLLTDIDTFFRNFDNTSKKLANDLLNKELERDDLLHEIELSKLNIGERARIYSQLEKVLQERRIIKNKIELLKTIKSYCDDYTRRRYMWRYKKDTREYKNIKK